MGSEVNPSRLIHQASIPSRPCPSLATRSGTQYSDLAITQGLFTAEGDSAIYRQALVLYSEQLHTTAQLTRTIVERWADNPALRGNYQWNYRQAAEALFTSTYVLQEILRRYMKREGIGDQTGLLEAQEGYPVLHAAMVDSAQARLRRDSLLVDYTQMVRILMRSASR